MREWGESLANAPEKGLPEVAHFTYIVSDTKSFINKLLQALAGAESLLVYLLHTVPPPC